MATPAAGFAQLASECEKEGMTTKNAERVGAEIAKVFGVRPDEVGILRLEKQNLVFVYPPRLAQVGSIPMNTSGAVAARTAISKRAEVINSFAQAKHVSVFEAVELGGKQKPSPDDKLAHVIQKLMSAPVVGPQGTVGVVEVCRKGPSGPTAGADFTPAELQKLAGICAALAKCFP